MADLAARGKTELAGRYLEGLDRANALEIDGQPWGFPEFLHGKDHTPGGTARLGWSAAAGVIGRQALQGNTVLDFRNGDTGQ